MGQLTDVYLQNLKKNDGLKWDGSKWINYNISADYTNKFLNIDQTNPQTVLNGSPLFQYLDIDTSKESIRKEGRLNWNSFDGTLEVMLKGGNVTNQIGMETNHQVHNQIQKSQKN